MPISTPVAFFIFNRPVLTQRVFEPIAQAQSKQLLIVADGPRFPEETERCQQARQILHRIDWSCDVLTNFSDINLSLNKTL